MPVVSMVNWRSGVGKTTLTLALADFLTSIHGRNVLVIDMDPQSTASVQLLGEDRWKNLEDSDLTLAYLFERAIRGELELLSSFNTSSLIHAAPRMKAATGYLHVIASSPRLQDVEARAMAPLASWSPYAGSPYMLLHHPFFKGMTDIYDYVLIDCPPSIGMITLNALTISSGYIIPTTPDYLSSVGLTRTIERVKQHADGLRRKIPLHGTVANRVRRNTQAHAATLEELRGRPEAQPLWDTTIPETVRAADVLQQSAQLMSLTARYGDRGHATYTAFEALAYEFLQRVS